MISYVFLAGFWMSIVMWEIIMSVCIFIIYTSAEILFLLLSITLASKKFKIWTKFPFTSIVTFAFSYAWLMDQCKLFKQTIKLWKFNIAGHNKNPSSIYRSNLYYSLPFNHRIFVQLNFSVHFLSKLCFILIWGI